MIHPEAVHHAIELRRHIGYGFAYSLVLFAFGMFASSLLVSATWVISRRKKTHGPVYADISNLILDRFVLNLSTAALVLTECLTVVWDNLCRHHFPLAIRWPVDIAAIIGIAVCGLRLFSGYVKLFAQLEDEGHSCPKTGLKCPVIRVNDIGQARDE